MSEFAVGIDLGGTNLKAALVHRDDGVVSSVQHPTEAATGPDRVVARIVETVEELIKEAPGSVVGVGIGSPGAINWERTTVSNPPNFPGWEHVNLRDELSEVAGERPVIVENDANVAALGSAYHGAGQPHDSFIMATLGTGVGGAIIYQNRMFRGSTGAAGEIGHMTIDYEGPVANSGVAGAIEAYAGQNFLTRHARYHLINYPDSKVYDLAGEDLGDLSPKVLFDAAEAGDTAARDIFAWVGHKLGCVLGSAVNLLDIRVIVVGGGVSAAGDYILDSAREALRRYVATALREGLRIEREEMGNEVGLLGAAQMIFAGDDAHVGD
ncbi:sugar kinase [Longibacter salinarum]|uniref:Sugar kinase n=1 Tax=Longibacter salinarum TaxID=1850348 RepID=A0A2A8CZ57_9BACT|nr:ROK family protein [Longibacter salinarum]PEN13893.1 sugar kinase [Longibacter salinarum]